jgi:acyl-CoA oxidase
MAPWVIEKFRNPTVDTRIRHGLAIITKAVFLQHGQQTLGQFVERCGAQGLFSHNQLVSYQVCYPPAGLHPNGSFKSTG